MITGQPVLTPNASDMAAWSVALYVSWYDAVVIPVASFLEVPLERCSIKSVNQVVVE